MKVRFVITEGLIGSFDVSMFAQLTQVNNLEVIKPPSLSLSLDDKQLFKQLKFVSDPKSFLNVRFCYYILLLFTPVSSQSLAQFF